MARLACKLPSPDTHARPARPRPSVWRLAETQSGSASPARASRMASALVEPVSLKLMIRGSNRAADMEHYLPAVSDAAAAVAASTSVPPITGRTNSTTTKADNAMTASALPSTFSKGTAASSKNMILTMRK
jgi:hypothetical protein